MEREGILNTIGYDKKLLDSTEDTPPPKIRGNVSKNLETNRKTHLDF